MNMKNLNVFRRLDELETDNLYLRTMLKSARADIKTLQAETRNLTLGVLRVDKEAQPKPKVVEASEKRREYARKYYAKKKAEKLAVTA